MPPSGNYSLRIAPAAARATANKTKIQNVPTLLAILMAVAMRRYYTARIAQWRRFMAFIKAIDRNTAIKVRAGTKNSRPVGFYSRNSTKSTVNPNTTICPKRVGSFGYSTDFLTRRSVRSDIDSVRKL
jgi:hypothetical protein